MQDTWARLVEVKGREAALTPQEFDLLAVFLGKEGRALSRDQLLGEVWEYGLLVTARSVDRRVKTLRKKLGSKCAGNLVVERGVGGRWGS